MTTLIKSNLNYLLTKNGDTKKVIGIDIDDTLYSFNDLAKEIVTDLFIEREDHLLKNYLFSFENHWRSPVDLLGEDLWNEIISICHNDANIMRCPPYNLAASTVKELAEQHEIWYISNRSPESIAATKKWLQDNGFPSSQNLICCGREPKVSILLNLGASILIDDRPKNLIEFITTNKSIAPETEFKAFGILKEYNSSLTDIKNIYLAPNWKLLRRALINSNILKIK